AGYARAKDGQGDGSGYAKIQGKGSGSGSGEGRGTGRGEGSGSRSGDGHGEGGGSGAGSSRSNPVKGTCRVPQPTVKDYPIQAAELGEEGVVGFVMEVSPDNRIASVRVVKSSGSSRLDRAAVKFVEKYPCDSKGKWQQWSGQIVYQL
ncbi:energy transducer TonB, partial [Neisseria dentiae]